LLTEWPQDVLPRLGLDRFTAVATLTHVPDVDDPALTAALRAQCFYVGALGSRRTQAKRREKLGALTDRIHGPVGLDLGGETPAEIALEILAQMLQAHRQGETPAVTSQPA